MENVWHTFVFADFVVAVRDNVITGVRHLIHVNHNEQWSLYITKSVLKT